MWMFSLSLFFTAPYDFHTKSRPEVKSTPHRSSVTLTLQGVFFRPDTQEWVVWINDCRLDSKQQRSLHGWYITHVTPHYVVLENQEKEKITLQFQKPLTLPGG